jgi:hypothetical protein
VAGIAAQPPSPRLWSSVIGVSTPPPNPYAQPQYPQQQYPQ